GHAGRLAEPGRRQEVNRNDREAVVTETTQGAASPRVAVLGIGTMGAGMARNLLKAGLPVDVWNRTPERAAALAAEGATAHELPATAVAQADVVITMLPDAEAVQSVAFGQGMLA